jgi:hypothetical protein
VWIQRLARFELKVVRAAYRDNYSRLVEIKYRYDPGNLFRVNQNILPASYSHR